MKLVKSMHVWLEFYATLSLNTAKLKLSQCYGESKFWHSLEQTRFGEGSRPFNVLENPCLIKTRCCIGVWMYTIDLYVKEIQLFYSYTDFQTSQSQMRQTSYRAPITRQVSATLWPVTAVELWGTSEIHSMWRSANPSSVLYQRINIWPTPNFIWLFALNSSSTCTYFPALLCNTIHIHVCINFTCR